MKRPVKNRGFIKLLLIIAGALLVIGYFNIDLQETVESPTNQKNYSYIRTKGAMIWDKYLEKPVKYFWNNIFINLLWNTFVSNFERMRDGQPTDFELNAPYVMPPAAT